jgi:hypothetical protein
MMSNISRYADIPLRLEAMKQAATMAITAVLTQCRYFQRLFLQ